MRRALVVLASAVVVFVLYAALARWVIRGPVTAQSLATSVEHRSGWWGWVDGPPPCRRTAEQRWTCEVWSSGLSGSVELTLRTNAHDSCWTATNPSGAGGDVPRNRSGCVHRWQWMLFGGPFGL